ncbi:hypothetical protein B0H63DRAFT_516498 [Podospora didyma]|uniref:Uncharacterized protein n=1 Tax=Podospora didyma TaxID=330526 RepID=A0AAE0U733_9PEZI|nr:hypothetical protein B0H63DRAFT_516498 [Podospora didyma]
MERQDVRRPARRRWRPARRPCRPACRRWPLPALLWERIAAEVPPMRLADKDVKLTTTRADLGRGFIEVVVFNIILRVLSVTELIFRVDDSIQVNGFLLINQLFDAATSAAARQGYILPGYNIAHVALFSGSGNARFSPLNMLPLLASFPKLASTLKQLIIHDNCEMPVFAIARFGPPQRLTDLPALTELELLVAPSYALFGPLFGVAVLDDARHSSQERWEFANPSNSGNPDQPDKTLEVAWRARLPPKLRKLEIIEDTKGDNRWLRHKTKQAMSVSVKLYNFFEVLSLDAKTRFPCLEEVVLWHQDWTATVSRWASWTDTDVDGVEKLFLLEGIKFTYRDVKLFGLEIHHGHFMDVSYVPVANDVAWWHKFDDEPEAAAVPQTKSTAKAA